MKDLIWVASSKKDLLKLPKDIQAVFTLGLLEATKGDRSDIAKTLQGFGGGNVIELKDDDRHGTYRCVYTIKMPKAVYVLHVFQKKSKQGIKTPKRDMDLVRGRIKIAENDYKERYEKK